MKDKASGIVYTPFWIKLFRFWPNLWVMMNCITWNHDRHSTWNCHSFDSACLITVPLESKEAKHYSGHNDSYFKLFLIHNDDGFFRKQLFLENRSVVRYFE